MYTRCPTCSTCFRVTDRHLAIANGKVRCGQCQLVFNAPEHAIDDLPINQLTPPVTPEAKDASTPNSNSTVIESPVPAPVKKVEPAPLAPTTKEKSEAKTQAVEVKKEVVEVEEIIEVKPSTEPAPAFDANATMIADISSLDKDEVENIELDISSPKHDEAIEIEDDDHLFNDNFDMDAAINELTQTTEEDQSDNEFVEKEEPIPESDKNEDSKDDIFQTDAYAATSAASVADILDEMEGQLSLNISAPKNDGTNEKYDASKEFDFLKLDDEPSTDLKTEADSKNKVDDFEILEFDDEEDELNAELIQEQNPDNELSHYDEIEDELFNQVDLSDFDDSDTNENIVLEEPDFENRKSQNIGQHAEEQSIPIQLRADMEQLQARSQHNLHPLLAVSFIVILLLVSFSQLAFFRAHELVQQIPSSRPLLEAFCKTVGCNYSGPRDIKQIQLLSRDVRLHPKEKKALLISAAMINNAYFSQPYPDIHIRLSDISGNVVAERIFNAKTYMGKLSNPFLLMKSQTPVHINFEVVDPGKDAINFEFTFL